MSPPVQPPYNRIPPVAASCASGHCITCADDGVPMRVLRVDDARALALCIDGDGTRSTVEIALVDPPVAGELLLVHAGTAIASLGSGRAHGDAPRATGEPSA